MSGTFDNKKLVYSIALLFLSTSFVLIADVLASIFLLENYDIKILPWFYFLQGLLTVGIVYISGPRQEGPPFSFLVGVKIVGIIVLAILAIMFSLFEFHGLEFIASVFLVILGSLIGGMAWYVVRAVYNNLDFKAEYVKLQFYCVCAAFLSGAFLFLNLSFMENWYLLLFGLVVIECLSLFFLFNLSPFFPLSGTFEFSKIEYKRVFKNHSLVAGLFLFVFIITMIARFVDFNFKTHVLLYLNREEIPCYLALVFTVVHVLIPVLGSANSLLLKFIGSKSIILVYPAAVFIFSLLAACCVGLDFAAALFCAELIFLNSTNSLSTSLYMNTLPANIQNHIRFFLSGFLAPCSAFFSFLLMMVFVSMDNYKLPLVVIMILSLGLLSIAFILMKSYTKELGNSVLLRRYALPEKVQSPYVDEQILTVINQAFDSKDFELLYFGVQLLKENKNLSCPLNIGNLLVLEDTYLQVEAANILAMHPEQKEFIRVEYEEFLKAKNPLAKWYITVYLTREGSINLLHHARKLFKSKEVALKSIATLIFLHQGEGKEIEYANRFLEVLFHSKEAEDNKWFLLIANESKTFHREDYLPYFIRSPHSEVQKVALQQVQTYAEDTTIDAVFSQFGKESVINQVTGVIVRLGEDSVQRIESLFFSSKSYRMQMICFYALTKISSDEADQALVRIYKNTKDYYSKGILIKYVAYKAIETRLEKKFKDHLLLFLKEDLEQFDHLKVLHKTYQEEWKRLEIESRMFLLKERIVCFLAALLSSKSMLGMISRFEKEKVSLENFDSFFSNIRMQIQNNELSKIFEKKSFSSVLGGGEDSKLSAFLENKKGEKMDSLYFISKLRKVEIFSKLSIEVLEVLSKSIALKDMAEGQVIFEEGVEGDGLYVINSGEVSIIKNDKVLALLKENDYFGELALLSDQPRYAAAVSKKDGSYFYIDKIDFDRLTNEVPEIMKSLARHIVGYINDPSKT